MAVFWVVAPCRLGPDDGESTELWNIGKFIPVYTALQPKRQPSSYSPPSEPQVVIVKYLYTHTLHSTTNFTKENERNLQPDETLMEGAFIISTKKEIVQASGQSLKEEE
jgi:hypothetical protein